MITSMLFGFSIVLAVGSWGFYGMTCMMYCGLNQTTCRLKNVNVQIRVCQDSNLMNHPYTGIAVFCFDAHVPKRNESVVLCTEEVASCASDRETAENLALKRFHSDLNCWYGLSSYYTDETPYFYLMWSLQIEPNARNTWFWINTGFSGLLLFIFLVACIVTLFQNRRFFIREPRPNMDVDMTFHV